MARRGGRVRVQINDKGVRELLQSQGVRGELERRAQNVLDSAKATAPVDTGEHRDSLHLEHDTTDRAAVVVVADSDHSLLAEIQTGHMGAALDAAGD